MNAVVITAAGRVVNYKKSPVNSSVRHVIQDDNTAFMMLLMFQSDKLRDICVMLTCFTLYNKTLPTAPYRVRKRAHIHPHLHI